MELCERVSGYYFTERYPMLELSDLTIDDVKKRLERGERISKSIIEGSWFQECNN